MVYIRGRGYAVTHVHTIVVSPLEEWIVNIRYRDRGNEQVVYFFSLFYQRTLDFRSDYPPFQRVVRIQPECMYG